MPITGLFNNSKSDDIHVAADHATPELWNFHAVVQPVTGNAVFVEEYQNHHADVRFRFIPRFRGTVTGHVHEGFGIKVNLVTGQVLVAKNLPTPRPMNFILDLEATPLPTGTVLRYKFRIHVHDAYDHIWLTPARLSIRRRNAAGAEPLHCRFSVRAQFTDGVVGDVTDNWAIKWGPAAANPRNVDDFGQLTFAAGDAVGTDITIRASYEHDPTHVFAEGILHVDAPWSTVPPLVAELVPGSLRLPNANDVIEISSSAALPVDRVPNVLMIGDGFTAAEAAAYRSFVIDIVHRIRQEPIHSPWNSLGGRMNFWIVQVDAPQYGVSVGAEVVSTGAGPGLVARIVPAPQAPPSPLPAGTFWSLEQMVHELGLPLRTDFARANADILADWTAILGRDPSPQLGANVAAVNAMIDQWSELALRGLADEVDSPLGSICGRQQLVDPTEFNLFDDRGGRDRMNALLSVIVADLPDAAGVVAKRPIGHLWAQPVGGARPADFDLICITAPSTGRELNGDGYLFVNMFDGGGQQIVDVQLAPGSNVYQVTPRPPATADAPDGTHGLILVHELSHSFNLNDEYGESAGPPTGTFTTDSNVQLETDARSGPAAARVLDGEEIKWRWHRIGAVGVVSAPITLAAGELTVTLRDLEAVSFAAQDIVHLRLRTGRGPLLKSPRLSEQLIVTGTNVTTNQVRLRATGVAINYPNLVLVAAVPATFLAGSVLYKPKAASAAVFHATNYPYAEMVAKNVKDFITRNHVPLVAFPPAANVPTGADASEQIPVFVPDVNPAGVGLAPGFANANLVRIVGLYAGGVTNHLGVFHPAGHCLMRSARLPIREFCAVCRYILVDTIDPSLHDIIDPDYDPSYPQA